MRLLIFGDDMEGEYGSEEYEILVRKWTWDGYKLGTLDMLTFKVTWISREAMSMLGELRTLACNSKGELYGTDYTIGGEKFMPHTGDQYFAGFFSASRDGVEVANDDYMISPTLHGNAQTVSFWAKGYRGYESPDYPEYVTDMRFNETLEVLYTTDADNLDPTTYEVAKEEFTIDDKEWTQYTADLPAGARHFALHRTSKPREYGTTELGTVEVPGTGSFIMMIDDICFGVSEAATGYNIYINGELYDTLGADATSFDAPDDVKSGDTFWVIALDADGKEFLTSNKVVYHGMPTISDVADAVKAIANGDEAADMNDDGKTDVGDLLYMLSKIKK